MFEKKELLIGSIALLVIAIQVVSCGGIGLDIAPGNIEVELGSTATYNITVYNYQNQIECFDITVIPGGCDADWFDWWQNEEFICISRNGQEQVSLNVTPNEEGEFKFTVNAHSSNALKASQEVGITVKNGTNQPPVDPSLSYPTPNGDPELAAGTAIRYRGSAVDPDGDTLYYRYLLKGPSTNNSWVIKRDWNADNTWTWRTDTRDIGDNRISMRIRDGHHEPANRYDLEIVCDYCIIENRPPCYGILVPTREEPQSAGTSITWVAYAEDPEGDTRYYRFLIRGPATCNSWVIKQDWSTNNIWVWNTTVADIGNTDIWVWVSSVPAWYPSLLEKKVNSYRIAE